MDIATIVGGGESVLPPSAPIIEGEVQISQPLVVFKYFLSEGKISPGRITSYGCASFRPVTSNETGESRALNRRVEIILRVRQLGAFLK